MTLLDSDATPLIQLALPSSLLPSLVHVLPDAHEMMSEAAPSGYPWAFAMALNGMLLVAAVNQASHFLRFQSS